MAKVCSKCKQEKDESTFYKRSASSDGLHPWCKACVIDQAKKWKQSNPNPERDAVYSRKCYRDNAKETNARTRKWQQANPEKVAAIGRKYALSNPEKRHAKDCVNHAITSGKLIRQPCTLCSTKEKVHAHHRSYDYPLQVDWLCCKCHNFIHRLLRVIEETGFKKDK